MKINSPLKESPIYISQSYKPGKHEALDIGYPTATANKLLCAVEDGVAGNEYPSDASWLKDTGFTLRGNSGALYLYQHCVLNVRGKVKRGDVIGRVDTLARQRIWNKNMTGAHLHFEIHPTANWNVRDQPLCYFDRSIKYNRCAACTSTPLNYSGLADKHLKDIEQEANMKLNQDRINKLYEMRADIRAAGVDPSGWINSNGYELIDMCYTLTKEKTKLQNEFNKLKESSSKIDSKVSELEKVVQVLRGQVGSLEKQQGAIIEQSELKDMEIKEKEEKIAKQADEITKMRRKLEEKDESKTFKERIDELIEKIKEWIKK